jgi:hypothetical protein
MNSRIYPSFIMEKAIKDYIYIIVSEMKNNRINKIKRIWKSKKDTTEPI